MTCSCKLLLYQIGEEVKPFVAAVVESAAATDDVVPFPKVRFEVGVVFSCCGY